MNLWSTVDQLFRYGLIGIATNLAGYLLYLLITRFGMEPKAAMTMLYLTGATVGFFGNRRWTFGHRGNPLESGTKYILAHVSGYMINLAILLIFVDGFDFPHQWVQGIAILIVALYLFFVFQLLVFPAAATRSGNR